MKSAESSDCMRLLARDEPGLEPNRKAFTIAAAIYGTRISHDSRRCDKWVDTPICKSDNGHDRSTKLVVSISGCRPGLNVGRP